MMFEILDRDGLARICKLQINNKCLETPTIFAVYNPNINTISVKDIERVGLPVITSSYILWKGKRDEVIKKGLHSFLNTKGIVMTDSGAFQAFQYGDIRLSNKEIIEFQKNISADIGVILDEIVGLEKNRERAKEKVEHTLRHARELFRIGKGNVLWAGTIQGGMHFDLIRYCARKLAKMDFDLYCIGSVVPFLENYRFDVVVNQILHAKPELPPSRPVHLFGAGHPIILALACLLGVDLFDSAYYALSARRGKYLLTSGQAYDINSMKEVACTCPVCLDYRPREFTERELALHNLYVVAEELKVIKQAIREERLWELVEQRIKAHPSLISAYSQLKNHKKYLEMYEPLSRRKGVFYLGKESETRPVFSVAIKRIKGIRSRSYFKWMENKVPLELKNTYPFGQTIFPWSRDSEHEAMQELNELAAKNIVKKILHYQFGKTARNLAKHISRVEISRATGRIRRLYSNDTLIGTIRAHDGLFVPSFYGAKLLHELLPKDEFRVIVSDEAVPFVRSGKNVFAKFVVDASENIRVWDEVLVVTKEDELIGCGTAYMIRDEMLSFTRGVAVETRFISREI